MDITWTGTIWVKKKDGTLVKLTSGPVDANKPLHEVGASYGVKNSSMMLRTGRTTANEPAKPFA